MRKKIIVLGGSSGIGKAIAERFANEGWQVLVAAHDINQCMETVNGLQGKDHLAVELDVRNNGQERSNNVRRVETAA